MEETDNPGSTRWLVSHAQAGDREALGALVRRYQDRLSSLVHIRLGPRLRQHVDPEDVLQETFIRVQQSLQRFEWQDDSSFFRWLSGIAEHVVQMFARHHLQTQKRDAGRGVSLDGPLAGDGSSDGSIADTLVANQASPSRIAQRRERYERLESALATLDGFQREVVVLARVYGLPTREIARRLDRSTDAVSMLLLRALRKLKEKLVNTDSFHLPASGLIRLEASVTPTRPENGASVDSAQGRSCRPDSLADPLPSPPSKQMRPDSRC